MNRVWRFGASSAFAMAVSLAGCNAILGNEEGTPRASVADGGGLEAAAGDAAPSTPPAPTCASGERLCFGACSNVKDPTVGCSAADCVACDPKNASGPKCVGATGGFSCAYESCAAAFLDCDDNKANGCEAPKNDKSHCGACTTKCEGGTPLCAPDGAGGFTCAAACPGTTTNCADACVDTMSDVLNCGGCGKQCSKPGASATCKDGKCDYICNAGTKRDCGTQCVSAADPKYCNNCQPCPALPGTVPSCKSNGCVYACENGRYDCDNNLSNGCESTKACSTGILCNGVQCKPDQTCCNLLCVAAGSPCLVNL